MKVGLYVTGQHHLDQDMVAAFDERRRVLIDGLRELGLETPWPRGAFYAFPRLPASLVDRGSVAVCEHALEEVALAIVPGEVFGMDAHVRLSYATSLDNVRRALERLGDFLGRQTGLQQLSLRDNYFSSEATDEILSQLVQSPALKTIRKVSLESSGNFDSDASVEAIATLLSTAPALK